MCSEYDNDFKLNSQHNLEDLYDRLMSTRVFTLMMKHSYEHQKLQGKWQRSQCQFADHLVLIMCFIEVG